MPEPLVEPLTPVQLRVLGALVEKEAAVPDTYPMTLNGLRTACNQKTSRDPIMDLSEQEILGALDELKAAGFARFVHASHGARSTKYRHVAAERLGLAPDELAALSVLVLRGPQTLNEIRVRTERQHPFGSLDEVRAALDRLASRDEPLVACLGRGTGQREERWVHLLGGPPDLDAIAAAVPAPPAGPRRVAAGADDGRLGALERRVEALEAALRHLGYEPPVTDG